MDAASWGAIAAVGGLALLLVGHVVKYAYDKGATDNRLTNIERAVAGQADAAAILSAITSTVAALGKSVDRLDAALDRINSRVFAGREV